MALVSFNSLRENIWKPDIFQEVKKETSAMKWVKDIFLGSKYFNRMLIDIHACAITDRALLQSISTGSFNAFKRYKISIRRFQGTSLSDCFH